jgi:hypothetical protein
MFGKITWLTVVVCCDCSSLVMTGHSFHGKLAVKSCHIARELAKTRPEFKILNSNDACGGKAKLLEMPIEIVP